MNRGVCWKVQARAAAALALSMMVGPGCVLGGGAGDQGDPDAGPPPVFTLAQARASGQILSAQITMAAKLYGPMTSSAFFPQCYSIDGDASDADGDSIPTNATLTLDCSERLLGVQGTLTGTFAVTDTNPNGKSWDFTASENVTLAAVGPLGGMTTLTSSGSITASQGGGQFGGPYDLAAAVDAQAIVGPLDDPNLVVTNGLDWTVSFAPGFDWSAGAIPVAGLLTVSGTWNAGVGAKSAVGTLTTPEPLTFNPNCQSLLTAGIVRAELAFGTRPTVLRVVWSGCGTPSVTFNANP